MSENKENIKKLEKALNAEKKKNLWLQDKINDLSKLEKEWKKLSIAVSQSPSITVIANTEGCIEYVNSMFCLVTGYTSNEVVGRNPRILSSGRQDNIFYQTLWNRIRSGETWMGEFENKRKSGKSYWEAAQISPLKNEAGEITHFIKVSNDVTERKHAEDQLQKDLKEKEILLKEVHHRVKNNLQIISSLLNLQAHRISDPNILKILEQSNRRVRSMALVHEKLYQSENFATIDLKVYIEALVMELFQTYGHGNRIRMEFKIRPISLSLDQAVPCGLIINELVSNALKYAFPKNRKGMVQISLHTKKGVHEIAIRDDGIGMAKDIHTKEIDTLGLKLVRILCDQIKAETSWHVEKGTEFRMKFKGE
ncbi:PAS domain S-box protein [candidate division KSB1 bacterium]|nr:PAS domain S-box protein [candidate division KSB1 bacterium]